MYFTLSSPLFPSSFLYLYFLFLYTYLFFLDKHEQQLFDTWVYYCSNSTWYLKDLGERGDLIEAVRNTSFSKLLFYLKPL